MDLLASCKKYVTIDKKMLPFKMHYLFFTLAVSSTSYVTVMVKNLGITATELGIIYTVSPFVTVLSNPLFGWITDKLKKVKFVIITAIAIQTPLFSIITFLPSISNENQTFLAELSCHSNGSYILTSQKFFFRNQGVRCELNCTKCSSLEVFNSSGNLTSCENILLEAKAFVNGSYVFAKLINASVNGSQLSQDCAEEWKQNCDTICSFVNKANNNKTFATYQFWIAFVCMVLNSVLGSAATALGDAACYEALEGKTLDFGKQRLWVSVGWGIGTMFIGYLLDLLNPNQGDRMNYSYCAYAMLAFITIDIIILSQASLKKSATSKNIFKDVFKIFRKPHPIFVAISVLFVGGLSGIQWNFVFWYLEDMGASKFLLGLSIAVICLGVETPFMLISGWAVKKIGRDNNISLAYLSMAVWFISISFIQNPWWILLIQLSQGPSYALFYAAITSYGKIVTSPGTEATMQTILAALFYGLGLGCGSMLGGLMFDIYGGRISYRYCGFIALGGAVIYKSLTLFVAGENTAVNNEINIAETTQTICLHSFELKRKIIDIILVYEPPYGMTEKNIRARIAHLLETGNMSDVTFLVGCAPNQKRFKLHKLILSTISDKFHNLFYTYMGMPNDRVEIPEIEPSGFEIILRYIYTDSFSVKNVHEATYAYLSASKYSVMSVMEHCFFFVVNQLKRYPTNIYFVYEKAVEFNDRRLKSECEYIIRHKCQEIMESEEFLRASPCFVQSVIQLDYLHVKNELFIFDMLLKWAKAECERKECNETPATLRKVMTPFLSYIRFLSMTASEFDTGPAITHVLNSDEVANIAWNIAFPGSRMIPLPWWCNGNTSERSYMTCQLYFCCYNGRIPSRKHLHSKLIQCSIKVKKSVYFAGVSLYVQASTIAPEDVKLSLFKKDAVLRNGQRCRLNTKTKILTVYLTEPVLLKANNFYSVRVLFIRKLLLCASVVRKEIYSWDRNEVFEVNPQVYEYGTVCNAIPHFRGFLYQIFL